VATITRFVNTASTAGTQDGTTNTPGNSGTAAYEALATAETSEQVDLVSAGDTIVFICDPSGGADTTSVPITGWTTGSGNEILIHAAAGSEHNGVSRENSGTGYQVLAGSRPIDIFEDYVIVEDIEFTINASSVCVDISTVTSNNLITFRRCIFSRSDTSSSQYLVTTGDADAIVTFENCLGYAYGSRCFDFRTSATITINHCGFLMDTNVGCLVDGSAAITNSWFFNNNGSAFHSASTAPASDSNNAANDTSMGDEGFSNTNSHESLTMADEITDVGTNFADPATADGTIRSDGTLTFDDAGTGSLTDDIANVTREGIVDIGPFELIGGGADVRNHIIPSYVRINS